MNLKWVSHNYYFMLDHRQGFLKSRVGAVFASVFPVEQSLDVARADCLTIPPNLARILLKL